MFEGCLFFNLAALWGLSTIDHLCRTSMRTAEQLHWVCILKGIRRWFRDESACSRPPCAETERRSVRFKTRSEGFGSYVPF
jgi:hypothetical protein